MTPHPRAVIRGLLLAVIGAALCPLSARIFESAPEGYNEAGVPAFSVMGPESLGLSAAPTDLKRLPDGRLVAMATNEIALGDGVRWEIYRRNEHDTTGPHDAAQMMIGPGGEIYAGMAGAIGQIEFLPDRTWRFRTVVALPEPWSAGRRVCNYVTDTGGRWLWFWGSGPVFSWRPGSPLEVMAQANAIEAVFAIGEKYYVSDQSSGRTYEMKEGRLEPADFGLEGYVERTITEAVQLGEDATLIGTSQRGLLLRRGGRTVPFSASSVTHGAYRIQHLARVGENHVAAAIEGLGIYFFDRHGKVVQVLDRTVDHRLASVRSIVPTSEGSVWALLMQGVTRVGFPNPISFYEPLVPTTIRHSQLFRHRGQLWLMTNGQALRALYDTDGRLTRFELTETPSYLSSMVELDGDFLASGTTGLFKLTSDYSWEPVALGPASAHIHPTPISQGRWLYAAENEYGWIIRKGDSFVVERFQHESLGHVFDAIPDHEGNLWLELGSGRVGRASPNWPVPVVEIFDRSRGVNDSWAQMFLFDQVPRINNDGSILRFDARQSRFQLDDELVRKVPILKGARGRPLQDGRGNLWVSHTDILQFLPGPQTGMSPLTISSAGLMPVYLIGETNGMVWLSEYKRLGRLDPSMPVPALTKPGVLLTSVDLADGSRVRPPASGHLGDLAANANTLRVNFMSAETPLGRVVTFESKLEGTNNDWTSTGTLGSVSFNRLGHGSYRLLVRARAGFDVGEPSQLSFNVLPPWYLTTWAYVAYTVGLAGLVFGAARFSSYMARRDRERLEAEVDRRTRELNEANVELAQRMREIVEQNDKRRALEAQMAQIQRVESVGTLAGGIAHDFNNVLTGMLGYCELAQLQLPSDSPALENLKEITANGMRAKDLIARILMYSRKADSQLKPVNLAEPVAEALKLLQATAPSRVRIEKQLENAEVMADATQIHQVVLNLGTNALHALGDKPGEILFRLRRTREAVGTDPRAPAVPHACLEVTDTGCGMDEETMDKIFEPFFTTKGPGQGTGLGLSTVQGIVANHGGQVRARSKPGTGTTIEVVIPLLKPGSASPFPRVSEPEPLQVRTVEETGEIILVDDEVAVARSTAAILGHAGYRIRSFTTPLEALAYARLHAAGLGALVTDLSMPHMTGIELARELLKLHPGLPVLFISGYSHPHLEGGLLPGARALLLAKPYRREDLLQKMRELLRAV